VSIPISKIIVWLIIGALAGTLAGRLMTFSKRGLGFWANVGFGMIGAVVGGLIFRLLHIDLGLGEIKITFEDLISAFVGSLLCIIAWRLIRKDAAPKTQQKPRGDEVLSLRRCKIHSRDATRSNGNLPVRTYCQQT